jgi:hypothetical protein
VGGGGQLNEITICSIVFIIYIARVGEEVVGMEGDEFEDGIIKDVGHVG